VPTPAQLFEKSARWPLGKAAFSRAVTWTAPYFASIAPRFTVLEPGKAEVRMKKRRAVLNHLGTVHAIAMCNLCELAAGTMLESSLARGQRWIPRGMSVRYLKKASTDLTARTQVAPIASDFVGDLVVHVDVVDARGQVVMDADINMYISRAKPAGKSAA
jgi:acyl-coenzyme A thioesterase PaaI-like protein